ncbi:MAG: histidine kinase [Clostridia bacterium]|nr:histidine kinase [Clostridia bacterium]
MKKRPLWVKCFILCLFGVIFSTVAISAVTFYRIYDDKEYIIRENANTVSNYVDVGVAEKLSMLEERFCGTNIAENIENTTEPDQIRTQLYSLCADSTDALGVYYIDKYGNNYAIGDVYGDLQSREELIMHSKKTEAYKSRGRTWFYLKTSRGYNACVLFADVIYVDSSLIRRRVGQMLLYVDADKINKLYIDRAKTEGEEGIAVIDLDGNIVFSTKDDWLGKNFYKTFDDADSGFFNINGTKYVYNSYDSDIAGWKNIVYFNNSIISQQAYSLFTLILAAAILSMLIVMLLSYRIAVRIGKPIDELFRYIKVSSAGKIVLPDNLYHTETDEIRTIFDSVIEKLKQQIDSMYLNEIELKNLKIKAYESQINPHFVFNTLQIIQMLSVLEETQKVNEVTTCLGELMRFNLNNASTVRMIDEIRAVDNYFKILKYRYQDKFRYKINIDEELYDCEVLKFTIQPFVENAVKHGFANKEGLWELDITAKKVGDDVELIISDNGLGMPKEKLSEINKHLSDEVKLQSENGIGIFNVHNRIRLMYGAKYGVQISCDNFTKVVIHMPFLKRSNGEGDQYV